MTFEYGQGLTDDMILGHVSWYSVTGEPVPFQHLTDLITDNGMDDKYLPSEPRPADAYKRACRHSERTNVPIPGTANKANFLIRKVVTDPDMIQRNLVMEVVDKNDKQLSYEVCAKLIWERGEEKLRVKLISLGPDYDHLVKDSLKVFDANFREALENIDPQVIRLTIRQALDDMGAISIRNRGSLYFVPISKREKMEALVNVISGLNAGSNSHSIPLIDDSKQREMITHAFQEEIHTEATQRIAEIMEIAQKGKQIPRGQWVKLKGRLDQLKAMRDDYRELLTDEMVRADTEMKAFDNQLKDLLMNDMVKE